MYLLYGVESGPSVGTAVVVLLCLIGVAVLSGPVPTTAVSTGDAATEFGSPDVELMGVNETVSEPPYEEPVPEPGDPYYEAEAQDGSWISYVNPRDEYRDPYLGDGSGKICVTLLNEGGDVIVGETVPNTTVEIPTGESLAWHSQADPWTVAFPLTEQYERPLDADQFGTSEELPQGDGWLDSHCLEWHGLRENATVRYGEATVEGEHANAIEVVGYIQQSHEAWDSDVDPIEDAAPYEKAGGWTYETDGSHGQAVVVLQLNKTMSNGEVDGDETEPEKVADDAKRADPGGKSDTTGSIGVVVLGSFVLAVLLAVAYARGR